MQSTKCAGSVLLFEFHFEELRVIFDDAQEHVVDVLSQLRVHVLLLLQY